MRTRAFFSLGFAALPLLASCGGGNVASELAKAPAFDPKGQSKCGVTKSQAKPLIVEWPSSDRAALESMVKRGAVSVRYEGCEMEVLSQCRAPGGYRYSATTVKADHVTIKDADDLYASVPLGAAKLEGKLAKAGELNVAMTIVGRFEAEKPNPKPEELDGPDCARATHVITAVTVGAFDFFAGADAQVGGGATVSGLGAGATSASRRETLTRDGSEKACEKATDDDKKPPQGCGAFLRIEVVAVKAPAPVCPEGSTWNGKQCVRTEVVTDVRCPAGSHRDGPGCAADVSTACTGGMHFVAGRGCLPDVATAAMSAPAAAPPSSPAAASGGGTFQAVGLVWQAKGSDTRMTWGDAKAYCAGGWRLPTKDELKALYDSNHPGAPHEDWFWSSTPAGGSSAWHVLFFTGNVLYVDVSFTSRVRCVR